MNYIVKNTIDPVVDERWQKAKERNESMIDATLSVKVLDPAMGSGHFLVGALEHLSARLMEAVTIDEEFGKIPDDERGRYTPEWAKREVAAHCIYGVDLNYLAVELAKVSLWLKTIAMDKPLSFLDHRLKCGNSLIGAKLVDLKEYPSSERRGKKKKSEGQSTLPSFVSRLFIDHLIGKIGELEGISDDSLSNIKRKERVFEEFRQLPEYRKAKAMADVHTAVYFGNEVGATANKKPEDVYHDIVWAIKGDEAEWRRKTNRAWFREAQQISEDKSFFHWELEYPDVFFEDGGVKENPGWDCVIGNPPYVNANELNKTLSEFEKLFWKEQFKSASGAYDLYILFLEQSINLTQHGHYSSLITPNKFLSAPYAKALRGYIHNKAQLIRLLNLSRVRVFEDPSIYPVISIIRNIIPVDTYPIVTEMPRDPPGPINTVTYKHNSNSLTALPDMIWGFLISDQLSLILKAEKVSTQLQQCSTVRASSTASEADAYEDALSKTSIDEGKKFINTGLIDRYATLWGVVPLTHKRVAFTTPYLRLTHSVVPSKRKTQYEKQKIVFAKMALRIEAFLDENGEYASANTNFVYDSDYDLRYLTALLNSGFMTVLYSIYFGTLIMSGGYFQFQAPQLKVLPIRRINFTTQSEERTALLESIKSRYNANEFDKIMQLVEECLPKDAEGNFITEKEKSDVVHDLLAFLAERMIEMNKEKNEEMKGFLEWFEREISAKIETLTNRTKLKQYHDLDFGELLDILKKNKKKIPVNISNRELQGNLKEEFEVSMRKLRPLIERIEKTDELIDQVVYRLYGLSEGDN